MKPIKKLKLSLKKVTISNLNAIKGAKSPDTARSQCPSIRDICSDTSIG